MKVVLPENIGEITLGQFQKYHELDKSVIDYNFRKKVISIFCNVKEDLIDQFPIHDIEDSYNQIMHALDQDIEFQQRFKMNGIEFGFHTNLDQMTGSEWVDLNNYHSEISNYHRLMAILYRPILEKDSFGNYELIKYNGTEKYAEAMKQLPMNIVNGCLVFFLNLSRELEISIHKYINKEPARVSRLLTTLKRGAGMLPS